MEISEQLVALKERVINLKDKIQREEATKNALVMPFIQLLGYDIFNPKIGFAQHTVKALFCFYKSKIRNFYQRIAMVDIPDIKNGFKNTSGLSLIKNQNRSSYIDLFYGLYCL